jgi:hypothetical protein
MELNNLTDPLAQKVWTSSKVRIVVTYNGESQKPASYGDMKNFLNQLGLQYWAILHDSDVDDNGILKKPHWHIVLSMPRGKRLKTLLNDIKNGLTLDDINQVSIRDCVTLNGAVRYLIHLDDSDKYQYSSDLVLTNDLSTFNAFTHTYNNGSVDSKSLIQLLVNSNTLLDVCNSLGFTVFNQYHGSIVALWNEIKIVRRENPELLNSSSLPF